MLRLRRAWIPVMVGALLSACNKDNLNPLTGVNQTVAPPASAALLFTSDAWSTLPATRELFAVDADGGNLTRLTSCGANASACDLAEGSPSKERARVMVRSTGDSDGDGKVTATDGQGLVFVDLARSVQQE